MWQMSLTFFVADCGFSNHNRANFSMGYVRSKKHTLGCTDWTEICCSLQTNSSVSRGNEASVQTHWSWGGSWPSDRRTPPSEASAHETERWLPAACRKCPWCPPHTGPPPCRGKKRERGGKKSRGRRERERQNNRIIKTERKREEPSTVEDSKTKKTKKRERDAEKWNEDKETMKAQRERRAGWEKICKSFSFKNKEKISNAQTRGPTDHRNWRFGSDHFSDQQKGTKGFVWN